MPAESKSLAADCERLLDICRAVGSAASEIDALRKELALAKDEVERLKAAATVPRPALRPFTGGPVVARDTAKANALLARWAEAAALQEDGQTYPGGTVSPHLWSKLFSSYSSVTDSQPAEFPVRVFSWASLVLHALALSESKGKYRAASVLTDGQRTANLTLRLPSQIAPILTVKARWNVAVCAADVNVKWNTYAGELPFGMEELLRSL